MAGLVYFIERIAPALFLVIAALLLIWLRGLMLARRARTGLMRAVGRGIVRGMPALRLSPSRTPAPS